MVFWATPNYILLSGITHFISGQWNTITLHTTTYYRKRFVGRLTFVMQKWCKTLIKGSKPHSQQAETLARTSVTSRLHTQTANAARGTILDSTCMTCDGLAGVRRPVMQRNVVGSQATQCGAQPQARGVASHAEAWASADKGVLARTQHSGMRHTRIARA